MVMLQSILVDALVDDVTLLFSAWTITLLLHKDNVFKAKCEKVVVSTKINKLI